MPIDPIIKQILDENPIIFPDTLSPELIVEIRKAAIVVPEEMRPPVHAVKDSTILGPNGKIPIRIYSPQETNDPIPAIVYFHGGGWTLGSIEGHDVLCRYLTNNTGCKVISVDYRLAPEHRFPKGLDDCYAATQWVFNHAKELHVDEKQIAIGGDSAGGNLSAAITLMAKDRKGPDIWRQILIYPSVDALRSIEDSPYDSIRENADAPILTSSVTKSFWDHYIQTEEDADHIYASPIRAKDLSDLPPAIIITAEYDPLKDEGEAYAARLKESGVPVQVTCYEGMVHGFINLPLPGNEQVFQSISEFLETKTLKNSR